MAKLKRKTINDFIDCQNEIKDYLKKRGIKQKFIYESIGMSRGTWTRRLNNNGFNGQEMNAILDVLMK